MKYYSFKKLNQSTTQLADRIKDGNYDYLCGIARGGLIPATILSYKTKIPMFTIEWQLRHGKPARKISDDAMSKLLTKKVLLVDEIVDSGTTINEIHNYLNKKVDVCSLMCRIGSKYIPTYHDIDIGTDDWINFEWENDNYPRGLFSTLHAHITRGFL